MILSIVNKAVSNFFHFSAENNYLFGIHKIIALAELLALDRYLKQDKILGTSDDLNLCKFGIYSYFSENGLPVNTPSGAVRGIILCLCSSGQISQLILEYNNSIIFHRVSYNEGVNWGSWKQL